MKRTFCWMAALVAGLVSGEAATIQTYINSSPFTNSLQTPAPIIDARVWINQAVFNIISTVPFEAYNNRLFTNSAALTKPMLFDPGVRFQRNTNGQRFWMDSWVNKGTIVSDHNNVVFSGLFVSDSRASILQVAATNIQATGPLFSGAHGLIRLEGKNVDVSRNSLRTGSPLSSAVTFGGGFLIGASNYVNDVGIQDLYWGGGRGDAVAANRSLTMDVTSNSFNPSFLLPSPVSTAHEVIERSTLSSFFFTNTTIVPSTFFFGGANVFINTNFTGYAAIANQATLNATSRVVQIIFYPTNESDPEFTTEARFYQRQGARQPASASVAFHAREFDIATQSTVTNSVYLVDALATTTNFFFARNLSVNSRRPNTFQVSRFVPVDYYFGTTGNVAYSSDLVYGNYTLTDVTNRYAAYAAQVDLLSSSPSGSIPYNVTNAPGRIELIADRLNLNQTRLRAESAVIIKTANLVSNNLAEIDAPLINFDARSTQPVFVISNLAPQSVRRFGGTVRAWSAVWENFEAIGLGTNISTNSVTFHVLVVESQLRSQVPVLVNEFAARATNVVIADGLTIGRSFAVEGNSLHLLTGLTLPLGSGLGASNLIGLRHFTNDGIINLSGPSIFGTDRALSYSNYVNRGTNIASSHEIRTRNFENSGALIASGGTFLLDSVTASLVGNPLIVSNYLFTNLTFDFTFGLQTNIYTNTATLQAASTISGVSDVEIRARDLVLSNSYITAGTLTLNVTNRLVDSGVGATNFWSVTSGFNVLRRPTTSDLFGTYLRSTSPKFQVVDHLWAGEDRGGVPSGFSNNLALGKLTFDGGERSTFSLAGVGTSNALYVDYIELLNSATNFNALFVVNPNLTIYFANANVPVSKLDGAASGRFRWVSSFTGPLSSTNITYPSGSNYTFNVALVRSKDLDSDGDGIVNLDDPTPIYVAESAVLSLTLASDPALTANLSWNALAYSSNYLEFRTSAVAETNWQILTNFHMGPYTWPVSISDPIDRAGESRVYRLRVDPGPY